MNNRPNIDAIDNGDSKSSIDAIDKIDAKKLQQKYSEFCQLHADCLVDNIINNQDINNLHDITLLGLSEGASALLYKNIGTSLPSDTEKELYTKVLNIVENEEDKIASLIIISKLCTEMLSKTHIAQLMAQA